MTNFVQLAYGLLLWGAAATNEPAFTTSSNRPFFDRLSQAELYEGAVERKAATWGYALGESGTMATVTNPSYIAGYWLFDMYDVTYTATGVWAFLSWAGFHDPGTIPYHSDSDPVWGGGRVFGVVGATRSWRLLDLAAGQVAAIAPRYARAYDADSVTAWTGYDLFHEAGMPSNRHPVLTVSNITALYRAITNLRTSIIGGAEVLPEWDGRRSTVSGRVFRAGGSTGRWYRLEMATGVVSTLDVSMIATQAMSGGNVSAVDLDFSFTHATNHFGPSTNRILIGEVILPTDAEYYDVTLPRPAVIRWDFLRCRP